MRSVIVAWVFGLGFASIAVAAPAIISVTGGQDFTNSNFSFTIGWQFAPTVDVSVTALGFYDAEQDGLVDAHPIGIFGPSGLVVSGTVPAGMAGTLDDLFRYTAVAPTLLEGGTVYRIGGLITPAEPFRSFFTGDPPMISVDPAINFQGGAYIESAALADPTTVDGGNRRFGPNFTFHVVPEPAAPFLMAVGILSAFGGSQRTRRLTMRCSWISG